jgi:hypothetical protein
MEMNDVPSLVDQEDKGSGKKIEKKKKAGITIVR